MENYNEQEIKEMAKELFSVCYDKGFFTTLGHNACMVTCKINNVNYFSNLGKSNYRERSIIEDELQILPIWELLEIVINYNNEK